MAIEEGEVREGTQEMDVMQLEKSKKRCIFTYLNAKNIIKINISLILSTALSDASWTRCFIYDVMGCGRYSYIIIRWKGGGGLGSTKP